MQNSNKLPSFARYVLFALFQQIKKKPLLSYKKLKEKKVKGCAYPFAVSLPLRVSLRKDAQAVSLPFRVCLRKEKLRIVGI